MHTLDLAHKYILFCLWNYSTKATVPLLVVVFWVTGFTLRMICSSHVDIWIVAPQRRPSPFLTGLIQFPCPLRNPDVPLIIFVVISTAFWSHCSVLQFREWSCVVLHLLMFQILAHVGTTTYILLFPLWTKATSFYITTHWMLIKQLLFVRQHAEH